jgi:N-acetylglucosamine-6-sulfatase
MLDRRALLKLAGAATALGATPADSARRFGRRGGQARPNFLHICVDDMRFDDVAIMPNLKTVLQAPSVSFDTHMAPMPLCAPSRAGILTGLQPHNHGVLSDKAPRGGYAAYQKLEANALPVWLTNAGYFVGHVGKFINGYDEIAPNHVPPGYADWRAMSCGFSKYRNFTLNENGAQVDYKSGQYTTDIFVEKVLSFLETAPQPFALFFWPNCCHWPADPDGQDVGTFKRIHMPMSASFDEADVSDKPKFIQKLTPMGHREIERIVGRWKTRGECLQSLDRGLATIMSRLTTSGLIDTTHVVFTSDNGYIEGEHRIRNAKDFLYEESARLPLYWRQPSGRTGTCTLPLSNLDATAAIVELSGATPQRVLDGTSLVPLLADTQAPWNSATLLQSGKCNGIATENYRYVEWLVSGDIELYDMSVDRLQLNNVAGHEAYADIQAACAATLRSLLGCAGDSCGWTGHFPPPPGRRTTGQ